MDTIGDFQYMSPTEYSQRQVPWGLQPEKMSTTSDAEQERLQTFRRVWLQLIDTRIASYEVTPIKQLTSSSSRVTDTLATGTSTPGSASKRVLGTAELLEKILRHANSSAQLIALGVCHNWRDVALYIMKPSRANHDFAHAYPCPPVKFGDRVPQQLNWLPATTAELEWLDSNLELDVAYGPKRTGVFKGMGRFQDSDMPNVIETIYYPGRITNAPNATSDLIYGVKLVYYEHLFVHIDVRPLPFSYHVTHVHLPKWVDVTQFRFNAYFANLFQDSLEVINGLCEVSLQPANPMYHGSTWDSLPPAAMSYFATQYITQPPVISLNVSTWIPMMDKPRARKALHIVNVRNDDGIRVSELLAAMKTASGFAVEHWKYWARLLHGAVDNCHPRQDFWVVDGRPKLLISLDPFVSGESRGMSWFYLACMHALPGKNKRQEEWIPRELWYPEAMD